VRILIISDDPERKSFYQISILKRDIENMTKGKVDLVTFSHNGIFLNQKLIAKKADEILSILENILKQKTYSVVIISLKLGYLKHLFLERINILDVINKTSPEAITFLYGANSVLKSIKQRERVSLHIRQGVTKLTQEFKNTIIQHIKFNC